VRVESTRRDPTIGSVSGGPENRSRTNARTRFSSPLLADQRVVRPSVRFPTPSLPSYPTFSISTGGVSS